MWWTRCQHDLQLRQRLPGFNKTNSLLCPLTLPVLFGKQSLSKSHLWNFPELLGEILLSPIYFFMWSFIQSLGMRVQHSFIYSFCSWNYSYSGHWGLCWLLGPVVLRLPYFMEGTGRHFRLHLVYTSCPRPRINTFFKEPWHWRKTRNQCLNIRHVFKCQRVGLNSKNLKKIIW